MTSQQFDWEAARRDWQQAPPVPMPDAATLQRQALRARLQLFAEALFNLLAVAILAMLAVDSSGTARWLLGAAAVAGATIGLAVLRARSRLLRSRTDTPRAFVETRLRQSQLRLRLAWLTAIGTPAGLGIGMVAALGDGLMLSAGAALSDAARAGLLAGALLLVASGLWSIRVQQRAVRHFARQLAELAD